MHQSDSLFRRRREASAFSFLRLPSSRVMSLYSFPSLCEFHMLVRVLSTALVPKMTRETKAAITTASWAPNFAKVEKKVPLTLFLRENWCQPLL